MNILFNPNENRLRAGWRVLLQLFLMIFFIGLGTYLIQFIHNDPGRLVNVIPSFIGAMISIWIAAKLLDKRPIHDYGLRISKRWWREFGAGCIIGVLTFGIIFLLEWSLNWIEITNFGWERASSTPFIILLGSYFCAMLLVGFYEEIFSRGYQILNLVEGLRYDKVGTSGAVFIAVLITSSLFGLLHAGNPNASIISVFNIILAGFVLALPYLLTGSLAISIGLHFSWNFAQGGIFGFPVSGIDFRTSILQIEQNGVELWTGGAFGPEAGGIGIIGMILIIVLSVAYVHRRGYNLTIHSSFRKEYQSTGNTDEQGL